MQIHKPVLFVGDKPSKSNVHPDVAFVGTRSYKTLLGWIADMDVDIYVVRLLNASDEHMLSVLARDYEAIGRVVALGQQASDALDKLGVVHYTLPHPSGRNRATNDKKALKQNLQGCKDFIYS